MQQFYKVGQRIGTEAEKIIAAFLALPDARRFIETSLIYYHHEMNMNDVQYILYDVEGEPCERYDHGDLIPEAETGSDLRPAPYSTKLVLRPR